MEDSDGGEEEFSIISQSFGLLETLSEVEGVQGRTARIQEYITSVEKEDLPVCPDFETGLEWFNVPTSLSLRTDLQGKLVVLDFFTYCCINCMHILPDLHQLEQDFSSEDGLVVIGVHSAKFDNEKVSSNILSAVLKYNITHAVVNDAEATLWNELDIQCWPTLVIVSPQGRILLHLVGEGHSQVLKDFVRVALPHYKGRGEVSNKAVSIRLSKDSLPPSSLLFPGKVSVDEKGQRLAIADTGHHRIVITDLSGVVQIVIGSGEVGWKDGDFKQCQFNAPQGVAWKGDLLFVADTENHVIREADLSKCEVVTIAGTGVQGNDKEGGHPGNQQPISSPWDVTLGSTPGSVENQVLFIAMAGTHQIWMYFLEDGKWLKGKVYPKGTCVRFAGNGAEENRNNNYPHAAAFAQPSGVTLGSAQPRGPQFLYIADSESSSVRSISLTDGAVKALVGATRDPRNLFAFGDKDGKGVDAKLQHPLGVTMQNKDGGPVLVADSYNHKIRTVDPVARESRTLFGSGQPGNEVGSNPAQMQLNEPGGLSMHPDGRRLFIADTNNHDIKVFDLESMTLSHLPILFTNSKQDVMDLDVNMPDVPVYKRLAPKSAEVISGIVIQVAPASSVDLKLDIQLSKGVHPTEGAPMAWQISSDDAEQEKSLLGTVCEWHGETDDYTNQPTFHLSVPTGKGCTRIPIKVECVLYYCDDDGACRMRGLVFDVILDITTGVENNNLQQVEHTLHYDVA